MNLFPNNPGQGNSDKVKRSSLGPKFLMMIVFTIVIGGMMLNFFQQGQRKDGQGKDRKDGSFLDGTPFDIRPPPSSEFASDEDPEDPDDPLDPGSEEEEKVRQLEPFIEKPELLARAAGRDRTGRVENIGGTVQEEGVIYLAHKLLSDQVAGKTSEAPVLNTAKDKDLVKKLLGNPDLYRGKMIELRANVVREPNASRPLQVAALPSSANPLNVNRLYRSYAYDQNLQFHLVYTIEDQSEDLDHMDDVVLTGYFCRLYTGEVDLGRKDPDKGTIPLLVASGYKKMDLDSPSTSGRISMLSMLIAFVLGICGIVVIVLIVVNRRSNSTYEVRRRSGREKGVSIEGKEVPEDKEAAGEEPADDDKD